MLRVVRVFGIAMGLICILCGMAGFDHWMDMRLGRGGG